MRTKHKIIFLGNKTTEEEFTIYFNKSFCTKGAIQYDRTFSKKLIFLQTLNIYDIKNDSFKLSELNRSRNFWT